MNPALTENGQKLRDTGLKAVGEVPWGTHFSIFYETKQDLLDILVPYFRAGVEVMNFASAMVEVTSSTRFQKQSED